MTRTVYSPWVRMVWGGWGSSTKSFAFGLLETSLSASWSREGIAISTSLSRMKSSGRSIKGKRPKTYLY